MRRKQTVRSKYGQTYLFDEYGRKTNLVNVKIPHTYKDSKLYNQIMQDGEEFNPYIHRRWLPNQVLRCVRSGRKPILTRKALLTEIRSRIVMSKHDQIALAFRERLWGFKDVLECSKSFYKIIGEPKTYVELYKEITKSKRIKEVREVQSEGFVRTGAVFTLKSILTLGHRGIPKYNYTTRRMVSDKLDSGDLDAKAWDILNMYFKDRYTKYKNSKELFELLEIE